MRNGDWIQTYSGLKVYPLDPRPEEICIEDIAHALSNICRFTGHCSQFYSVAQHSVYVSTHVSEANALWGLLHDASEAYLCDIARPVKHSAEFSGYRGAEKRMQAVIAEKFGLSPEQPEEIDVVDKIMLVTEARDLGLLTPEWSHFKITPLELKIHPVPPENAKRVFLDWLEVIKHKSAPANNSESAKTVVQQRKAKILRVCDTCGNIKCLTQQGTLCHGAGYDQWQPRKTSAVAERVVVHSGTRKANYERRKRT